MTHKVIIFIVLFLHSWSNCNAQSDTEALLNIIGSDVALEIRQKQIDSFLTIKTNSVPPAVLADCYHELGNKWYYGNWRRTNEQYQYLLDSAITYTRRACQLKQKLDSIDHTSLKKSLFNLGFFQTKDGAIFEAIQSYLTLIDLGDEDIKTTQTNYRLGLAYMTVGDYHKAIGRLRTVLSYYQNNPANSSRLAGVHIGLAETYAEMGYVEYASPIDHHLSEAGFVLDTMAEDDLMRRAEIDQLRGNLMVWSEKYAEAITYHKKVLAIPGSHSDENLAFVYNSLGVSYDKLGDTATALQYFNKSLLLNPGNSALHENLGDLYANQNNIEKGLSLYQKAIALTTNKNQEVKYNDMPTREDLELSPDKTFLLSHLVAKANGWLRYYDHDANQDHLDQALKTFERADQLIDIIRSESSEHQSKLYWRGQSANLYMKAVEACYLLGKPEQAYYFMERNKALLLLEEITHEQAKQLSQLPDNMARREFELKRTIHLSENELRNTISTSGTRLVTSKKKFIALKGSTTNL